MRRETKKGIGALLASGLFGLPASLIGYAMGGGEGEAIDGAAEAMYGAHHGPQGNNGVSARNERNTLLLMLIGAITLVIIGRLAIRAMK